MAYLVATSIGGKRLCTPTALSGTFTSSGTTNVSLESVVPKGTRAVTIAMHGTDATTGTTAALRATGGSVAYVELHSLIANQESDAIGDVLLDANYTFDLVNSAAWDTMTLRLVGLYA